MSRAAAWPLMACLLSGAGPMRAAPASLTSDEVFNPERAHAIEISLSAEAWELLQPGAGARKLSGETNRAPDAPAAVSLRPGATDYAYVRGELTFDGQRWPDIGLRFKGNSSYAVSAGSLRRPMRVDFDRFVERRRFAGLESINLSNTTFDPSQVREALGFWLCHQLGVPASRIGHALVSLTVTGKHDRAFLGLYTLIEEIDPYFLRHHFGRADGLLLKPSGMRGFAYLGETWEAYRGICNPQGRERPELCETVVELGRLIHRADDATFRARIGKVLAVDEFLRYVAVNSAILNFDSFLSTGHNYYLYVNPRDGLIYIIPWDLNMSFGAYGWLGTDEEIAQADIHRSYADHNILIERLLAIEGYAKAYRGHLAKLVQRGFNAPGMRARRELMRPIVEAAERAGREAPQRDEANTRSASGMGLTPPDLWPFVAQRVESVQRQLEGKQAGFKPDFRNPRRVLQEWAPLTVAAVVFMTAADTDGDRRLDDAEVQAGIRRLLEAANRAAEGWMDQATAVAVFDKLLPEDLRRRVPAKAWADWLWSVAAEKESMRVTADGMFAAYRRFQGGSDRDRDGRMDGRDLLEALQAAGAPRDPDPARAP